MALSACAIEGDFGRPQPTIFDRVTNEFLSSDAALLGSRGGSGVTNDEMAMREAGHRLASPLIAPSQRQAGPIHPLQALGDELNSDHQVLTQFGIAARRVLVADSRRMQAVYDHDPNLLVEDKRSSRDRMKENFSFVDFTFEEFGQRMQAYFYAIEESRANNANAAPPELEGSLRHLRDRSESLKYELTHYFGTAVARSQYRPPRFASRERRRYQPVAPNRRSDQRAPYSIK